MQNPDKIDISIVIVNYKTPELLYECINSIFINNENLSIEIIVVDNDSKDDSESLIKTKFPSVIWINTGYNAGFSRANNKGIKIAKGEYILILNSDTLILKDSISDALTYYKKMETDKLNPGLLACRMKNLDNVVLYNVNPDFPGIKKIWNSSPIAIILNKKKIKSPQEINNLRLKYHSNSHEVAWLGAAFALCNRSLFEKDNLYMDEDFFMYAEDMEWCYRIMKKGYVNYFYSDTEIIHINCGSSQESLWKKTQVIISEWLYIYKTRGIIYYLLYFLSLKIKLWMDNLFYLKKSITGNLNDFDKNALKERKFLNSLIKNHSIFILKNYKKKPSSSQEFLKYNI